MSTKKKTVSEFSPSFDAATGRYTWMVDYDESITDKLRAQYPGVMHTIDVSDEHFPEERHGKQIVGGRIWHPNVDLRQRELERKVEGLLARPKELADFSKAFPRPTLGKWVRIAAAGQLWETKGGPFDLSRDYRAVTLEDDSNWRHFGTQSAICSTMLNPDIPLWGNHWSFLVLDRKSPAV